MKVQYTYPWNEEPTIVELAEYLTPDRNGIESQVYQLQQLVGKLLAIAVENKTLTLRQAMSLLDKYDSDVTLVE